MKYALQLGEMPVFETDEDGNVQYDGFTDDEGNFFPYFDKDGNKIPILTGEYEIRYSEPVPFSANINNKLDEVAWREYGIDNSANYAQIVVDKNTLPLKAGSVIWKKSEVDYKDEAKTIVDDTTADYVVKGVADEGLSVDLFLLQRTLK